MSDNLKFRFLSKEDIDDILKLTGEINAKIKTRSIFSEDTKEELEEVLDNGGHFLGVYDGDDLIAYRSVKIPDEDSNVAKFIKNFEIPLDKVLINDTVVVKEDYRGRNLQNRTRDEIAKKFEDTQYTHRMGTVSPMNPHSFNNTFKSGYNIIGLEKLYPDEHNPDGYYRFIVHKSDDVEYYFTGNEKYIHHEDIDKIKEAIDEFFYGVEIDKDGYILFKEADVKVKDDDSHWLGGNLYRVWKRYSFKTLTSIDKVFKWWDNRVKERWNYE